MSLIEKEIRLKLIEAGYPEDKIEHIIEYTRWTLLDHRTIAECLLIGQGDKVLKAIDSLDYYI